MSAGGLLATLDATGEPVEYGQQVTDFRGETWVFLYPTRAGWPGGSGKVLVANGHGPLDPEREFYDRVFGITVTRTTTS